MAFRLHVRLDVFRVNWLRRDFLHSYKGAKLLAKPIEVSSLLLVDVDEPADLHVQLLEDA